MLDFAYSLLALLAATAIPAFLGLLLVTGVSRMVQGRDIAAFALGVFMWFFVDALSGSAYLDVNAGFTGGWAQVTVVALFAIGLLFFISVGGGIFSEGQVLGGSGLAIPLLVAVAVGLHGLGEGAAYGATASSTPSTSLLDAFGGIAGGVSYIMHKAIEPTIIGAGYAVHSRDHAKSIAGYLRDAALLATLFVVPSLVGAFAGYHLAYDSTYFFALGAGASLYAALTIAKPLFVKAGTPTKGEPTRTGLLIVLGFLCIYLAALLHS